MQRDCDACQGIEPVTPQTVANRPGLPALRYRAGTHGSFLESMIARLSTLGAEKAKEQAQGNPDRRQGQSALPPSTWLRSREPADPTIAMLDAWATVGDILTFYQERIANEGYLSTALERRSLHELANLVGYKLRPALSSSVYLAFDVQPPPALDREVPPAPPHEVLIPKGTQARHIPGPGELPQVFETKEDLIARPEWNQLKPRMTKPTVIDAASSRNLTKIRVERLDLGLHPGDLLLFVCPKPSASDGNTARLDQQQTTVRRILDVQLDNPRQQTVITLVDSPFSLVAYRDAITRAAAVYLEVTENFDSSEAPILVGHHKKWSDAMGRLREIAVNDQSEPNQTPSAPRNNKSTLIKTDVEVMKAIESLYPKPTWKEFNDSYTNISQRVAGISSDLRKALLDLFVNLNGTATAPGWQQAFEAMGRVQLCVAGAPNGALGYNSAVRSLLFVDKDTTAQTVVGHTTTMTNALVGLASTEIDIVARTTLSNLTSKITTALDTKTGTTKIGQDVATKIIEHIKTEYGTGQSAGNQISKWKDWLDSIDFTAPPWQLPTGAVVDQRIWIATAQKADAVLAAAPPPTPPQKALDLIENEFQRVIAESVKRQRTSLNDAIKGLIDLIDPHVEQFDIQELTSLPERFSQQVDPKTQYPITRCVNATLLLLRMIEGTSSDRLSYQINRDIIAKHLAAADIAQRLFQDASKPAAAAVVSNLRELRGRYPESSKTAKYLDSVIKDVTEFQFVTIATPSAPKLSRLKTVKDKLFLQDNAQGRLDEGHLKLRLVSQVDQVDVPVLIARFEAIDAALKTPAPAQALVPFKVGTFGAGLGATGDLLGQWQTGDSPADDQQKGFSPDGDLTARMLTSLRTPGGEQLLASLKRIDASVIRGQVYSFASRTGLFGASAPHEVKIANGDGKALISRVVDPTSAAAGDEKEDVFFLDQEVLGAVAGGWCLEGRLSTNSSTGTTGTDSGDLPFGSENLFTSYRVLDATHLKRDAYEQSGKTTRLQLDHPWVVNARADIPKVLRSTIVLSASRELLIADEVLDQSYPDRGGELELEEYYPDLSGERMLEISGEVELDASSGQSLPLKTGVTFNHQCHLRSADGQVDELGRFRTKLAISPPIPANRRLVRSTVRIYANVVEATNGSTVEEVIGNGEGQGQFQRFLLSQPRLTYLPAETPTGMKPELEVRVNSVEWNQAENVGDLQPVLLPGRVVGGEPQRMGLPRKYLTSVDDDQKTFLTTGDGLTTGERLPTGITNVRATYRVGGGKGGNVKEGTITQLASPPLNVTKVRNLMPASGGVDRENVDQARKNLPVSVMALDRLVSVADYESFARKFAGIAKAQATLLPLDGRDTVVVTIAALDDQEIDKQSLLYKNLDKALGKFADPEQAVIVEPRELMLLMTKARIKVEDGYRFEDVKVWVRDRILKRFDFEKAQLGESVRLSDLIETIQNTRGVRYVDVDMFDRMRQFYGTGDMVRKAACIAKSKSPKSQIKCGSARIGDIDVDEVIFSRVMKDNSADLMTLKEQIESLSGFKKDSQATLGPPGSSPPKVEDHFVSAKLVQSPETAVTGPGAPITEETQVSLRIFEVRDDALRRPPNSQLASQAPFPAQLAYFTDLAGTILLEEIQ